MKRNTALFGASLVAGVAAATGLVMTSTPSSAAGTYYGAAWADASNSTSSGWADGAYGNSDTGSFWGTASGGKGTFQTVVGSQVSVSVTCDGANPVTTVTGGGAAGTYQAGDSVTLAKFVGNDNVIGSVSFGKTFSGHTAGAYIDMSSAFGEGTYVALTGADCTAGPTSSTTSSTSSSSSSPSSSSSSTASSSTTNPPTSSTTNPPTSSTTAPPTSTPPTTPPPTTEPPTPTPTTTTLPVTG